MQSLGEPSDLFVDIGSSLLFWSDIKLKRIEKSDLLGQERQAIVITDIFGPVAITVQGDSLFWADRSQNTMEGRAKLFADKTYIEDDFCITDGKCSKEFFIVHGIARRFWSLVQDF